MAGRKPMSVRISAHDRAGPGGNTANDAVQVAHPFKAAGGCQVNARHFFEGQIWARKQNAHMKWAFAISGLR